eukprot:1927-Prymnesium_polylepis.2
MTWNMGPGTWDMHMHMHMGHGTWDMGHGTWDMGHGTWYMGHGTWDVGHGTWDMGHGTWQDCSQSVRFNPGRRPPDFRAPIHVAAPYGARRAVGEHAGRAGVRVRRRVGMTASDRPRGR